MAAPCYLQYYTHSHTHTHTHTDTRISYSTKHNLQSNALHVFLRLATHLSVCQTLQQPGSAVPPLPLPSTLAARITCPRTTFTFLLLPRHKSRPERTPTGRNKRKFVFCFEYSLIFYECVCVWVCVRVCVSMGTYFYLTFLLFF